MKLVTRTILSLTMTAFSIVCSGMAFASGPGGWTRTETLQGSDVRGDFKLSWIQLTDKFPDTGIRLKVNELLKLEAFATICEPDPENRNRKSAETVQTVALVSSQVLNVVAKNDVYCGGLYPSSFTTSLIFDLRTGAPIEIEQEVVDQETFRRFIGDKAVASAPVNPAEASCREYYKVEQLSAIGYVYVLSAHELMASPDFPHAIQSCAFTAKIPIEALSPFLKKTSVLRSLLKH